MLTTRDKVRRLVIALVVVASLVGLGVAISNTREVDEIGEPVTERGDPCAVEISGEAGELPRCDPQEEALGEVVERLFPSRDSQALQGVQVGIDLGPRFTGTLVVAGAEVPEGQLQRVESLNQVFFSPGRGRVIEEWQPGRNCVRAIVWPVLEGRGGEATRSIDWCFEVT